MQVLGRPRSCLEAFGSTMVIENESIGRFSFGSDHSFRGRSEISNQTAVRSNMEGASGAGFRLLIPNLRADGTIYLSTLFRCSPC